ncbi:epoxide hydrolase family protein [Microbacterium sp. EST19A]|uniref:epoxide hydrolase family protein n=1 Tax=Microbacterium sp. EST19A TaxID=2862681 RepID=UPI001CBC9B64|nr:epoxide hydrolase family protein [Microbacterium sp. EST19A]
MTEIRPFQIAYSQEAWDDLRDRLARARWPEKETVDDWSQGLPLRVARDMCDYWLHEYDWRARQDRLNSFAQFTTDADGLEIHFVHVRSSHPDATPLLLTHGWPGSFVEFLKLVGLLTEPETHGAPNAPAFHVVIPSLPGYAFSGKPTETGWGVDRIARAWAELMDRLDYETFGAAGSDWGTSVSASLGRQFPDRVIGLHLIPPLVAPDRTTLDSLTAFEQQALDDLERANATGSGYSAMHSHQPQTIGYALVDSPVALCTWMLEKFWAWTDNGGDLHSVISRDEFLDNVMTYWMTGSGASSARLYWESFPDIWAIFNTDVVDRIEVPVGASIFPAENPRPSRRWAERRFTDIRQWHELERGGHFASFEQPQVVVAELREFFGGLGAPASGR